MIFFFCIWALWFFGMLNIELQIWMGNVQYTINHQHKYFPSTPGHFKIVKLMNHWNQMVVVEHILLHKIKFKSQNKYPWTRKIHTIKRMGIFICTYNTINKSFGRPKHLFSFKMHKVICERWPRCEICHNGYKFGRITWFLCPLQQ